MSAFDFFGMMGNYESRKVDNFKEGKLEIDTAAVTDARDPYETAVKHPKYNRGSWVIVETYRNKEDAIEGHKRWVATMTADTLPEMLRDVSNAEIADFTDDMCGDSWRNYYDEG